MASALSFNTPVAKSSTTRSAAAANTVKTIAQINFLKVYEVDATDNMSRIYELQSSNGQLLVTLNNSNETRVRLASVNYQVEKVFFDVNINEISIDSLLRKNNKLDIKLAKSKNKYYAIEASTKKALEKAKVDKEIDEFIETLKSLKGMSATNPDTNNRGDHGPTDDELTNLCKQLSEAIESGSVNEATFFAAQLSTSNVKLKIEIEKDESIEVDQFFSDGDDDIIIVENANDVNNNANISHMESVKKLDIECTVMQDNVKNRSIKINELCESMTIKELKFKIFSEHKYPVNSQYWIINNSDTSDDHILKFYLNGDNIKNQKFILYVLNEAVAKPNENTSELDEMMADDNDIWQCCSCTFINEAVNSECAICSQKRPEYFVLSERNKKIKFDNYYSFDVLDLNLNSEHYDCDICLETDIGPNKGVILKDCLHVFCKECLKEHIMHSDEAIVKCPYSKDYVCGSVLQDREIRSILNEEDFDKFQQRSLRQVEAQMQNTFHCKTPNCIGFCVHDGDLNFFYCALCQKHNCVKCDAQHMEKTCEEYQNDLKIQEQNEKSAQLNENALKEMVRTGEAMNCPQCKSTLLKEIGCDWVMCYVCRLEICWATKGPRWGPKGHGDTTGGCGCNFMAKKCTPTCQNCH